MHETTIAPPRTMALQPTKRSNEGALHKLPRSPALMVNGNHSRNTPANNEEKTIALSHAMVTSPSSQGGESSPRGSEPLGNAGEAFTRAQRAARHSRFARRADGRSRAWRARLVQPTTHLPVQHLHPAPRIAHRWRDTGRHYVFGVVAEAELIRSELRLVLVHYGAERHRWHGHDESRRRRDRWRIHV